MSRDVPADVGSMRYSCHAQGHNTREILYFMVYLRIGFRISICSGSSVVVVKQKAMENIRMTTGLLSYIFTKIKNKVK